MALNIEQLSFFTPTETEQIEDKVADLQKKIGNLRKGLFKRYSEMQKTVEFLEGELEDLVKSTMDQSFT